MVSFASRLFVISGTIFVYLVSFLLPALLSGGHSFYNSVDMHLFLMGLVAVFVFSRSERAGVALSAAMIVFGTVKVAHTAYVNETSFSLFVVNPIPEKIVQFFHLIHMQTTSYLAAYFSGILLAFYRLKGYLQPNLVRLQDHVQFVGVMTLAGGGITVNAMLRNTLHVYPDHLNWLFISMNRILQLTSAALFFLYLMSFRSVWETRNTGQEQVVESFSPFKALCRLCFPLYICNYLYIRTEFFSRRFLEPAGLFWMMKRLFSSLLIVYMFTVFFQLCLLAPVDVLRDRLMGATRKSKQQEQEDGKIGGRKSHGA